MVFIMKKFMQGCAITALVLIVLGFAMALIAGTVKGEKAIETVVESVTGGKVKVNFGNLADWGITVNEATINYKLEDSMIFDDSYDILKGDVDMYSVGNDIREIDIEVSGCAFAIKKSKDADYHLEAENTYKFQGYVKDDTLFVKGTVDTVVIKNNNDCKITLYVPENSEERKLDKVDIELGAGSMEIGEMVADKVLLEVGAGQIKASQIACDTFDVSVGLGEILIDNMQVEKLQGEVAMGHLYLSGAIYEKADVECGMGSLEMVIDGAQADFDYDIDCGMGNIDLGDDSYGGIAQEKRTSNGASKKMIVKCAMGDVDISFRE